MAKGSHYKVTVRDMNNDMLESKTFTFSKAGRSLAKAYMMSCTYRYKFDVVVRGSRVTAPIQFCDVSWYCVRYNGNRYFKGRRQLRDGSRASQIIREVLEMFKPYACNVEEENAWVDYLAELDQQKKDVMYGILGPG